MHRCRLSVAIGMLLLSASPVVRAATTIGDVPPPLTVTDWVKGKPFELGADTKDKVVVVEFWATWCPPCIQLIPDTTELYQKYKSKGLMLIAVTDGARGQTLRQVQQFVESQGAKMDFPIAFDKTKRSTVEYGAWGLPHAVVIDRTGKVAWTGHPGQPEMKEIVVDILEGRYDPAVMAAARAREQRLAPLFQRFNTAVGQRDWNTCLTTVNEILAIDPSNFDAMRFTLAIYIEELKNISEMRRWVENFLNDKQNNADALTKMGSLMLAMPLMTDRQPDLAVRGADLAYQADGRSSETLQAVAQIYFQIGDIDAAMRYQREAVKVASAVESGEARQVLGFYEKCKSLHSPQASK